MYVLYNNIVPKTFMHVCILKHILLRTKIEYSLSNEINKIG